MTLRLRPEDRADFAWVLALALDVTEIRTALARSPVTPDTARLRARALADADGIAATAADEYRTYLRARAAVMPSHATTAPPAGIPPIGSGSGATGQGAGALLPALGVLTPLISAVAATVFLLFGYGLRFATPRSQAATTLVTAGWVCALAMAVSTGIGLCALLATALRSRARPPSGHSLPLRNPEAERARSAWHQALLERGLLPYLRRELTVSPPHAD
ncbi:hypothetical protein [Streptomyces spectabilis]|uniref:Transmembrane protein n=1 Tax=Streptomyces spectabilis TaxID=68270 RepID=A0A5P2WYF2_STRST|nr:hypothetical protein [Streptomyces spectabilis]MBB5100960.1 hypothetical protein [Streptomyces spectabilis]MCI3900173.1 hypothetical protein [Streptomyces spectabilis]QEV57783.1 hypothetical protein CP982_02870 [Streptomyces spectabilis]GGV08708.1 membrane protein [Streptomyces spectabilis]